MDSGCPPKEEMIMAPIKTNGREVKRIDGKVFEIWRRFTTKAEAIAEKEAIKPRMRNVRVMKDAKGWGVWVTTIIGTHADKMKQYGTSITHYDSSGRPQTQYFHSKRRR